MRELDLRLPEQTTIDGGAGIVLWPGLRLFLAFRHETADSLMLEGQVFEILAARARPDQSLDQS